MHHQYCLTEAEAFQSHAPVSGHLGPASLDVVLQQPEVRGFIWLLNKSLPPAELKVMTVVIGILVLALILKNSVILAEPRFPCGSHSELSYRGVCTQL